MKKVQIIVRSDPAFKRQVAKAARRSGVSVNELVIASLTRSLKSHVKRRAA